MKRFLLIALATLALALPTVNIVASQMGAKVTALNVARLLTESGWTVRDGAIDVLQPGGSKIYPVTLYFGQQYRIVAAGDEEAADVDVGIYYGPEAKFLAKDDDNSNVAVVTVTPGYTDQFYIKVVMARTKTGGPAYFNLQYASKPKG
ncbi:MAG: hypothetical protein JSR82_13140 [Verrucomicrobia bacterium]|nr:hypothetical protein [Verrucomicrobiota bacterium]